MVLTPLFSTQTQKARGGRGANSLRDGDDDDEEDRNDQLDFSKIGSETVSPTIRVRRRKSPVSSSSSSGSFRDGFADSNINTSPSDCSSGSSEYNSMGIVLEKYDQSPRQASPLHKILREAKTIEDLEAALPLITAESACFADAFGRTALHIFAENSNLSQSSYQNNISISPTSTTAESSPLAIGPSLSSARSGSIGSNISVPQNEQPEETAALIKFVVSSLWPAYHASLMTTDKKGYIPFEEAIRDWVDAVYNRCARRTTSGRTLAIPSVAPGSKVSLPSILDINSTIRWRNSSGSEKNDQISISQEGNNIETVAGGGSNDVESGGFRSVRVLEVHRDKIFPEHVIMASHAMYSLKMLSALLEVMVELTNAAGGKPSRRSKNRKRSMQDDFRTTTLKDMRDAIVQTVASIPDFVKLVLIINDDEQRDQILRMPLMKYVLIHKASVGTWLTGMLQNKSRIVSDISIHYLHLVSTVTIVDEEAEQDQIVVASKLREEMQLRDEFYQEASRLEDFVPSLLSMGEEQIEEAATTKVVQQVLDRIISRPFAVTIVFCDAIFLTLFIFGFRGAVNRALLGGSASSILTFVHLANTGIFYFLIRETGKGISLCMVTRKARTYFVSFWNLIDLGTIVLGLVSTVAIRSQPFDGLRNLCAVTTGLLWLRVLSYLKGINMQLATFVLAILQITRDILWFCVILCIVVVLFSQMFFTLLSPNTCSESDMRGDKECSQNEYYLKVYAILLGDFGLFQRDSFASAFSVVLVVTYTFFVVLVLLNVLIAVASDSYEKCLLRSQNLFGRARVMMIAELVSFQQLLRRNSQQGVTSSSTSDLGLLSNSWWSSDSWINGWSRGSLVFFSLSFLIFLTWTIGELSGYFAGPRLGNAWLSFGSIFVNVGLYVGVMFFLASGATDRSNIKDGDDDSQSPMFFFRWYGQYFQQMMVRVLGSSGGSTARGDDLWKGRLVFLQSEMSKIAQDTKTECRDILRGVEKSVLQSETQLRSEVSMLERSLITFVEEQRKTNERINDLLDKRRW